MRPALPVHHSRHLPRLTAAIVLLGGLLASSCAQQQPDTGTAPTATEAPAGIPEASAQDRGDGETARAPTPQPPAPAVPTSPARPFPVETLYTLLVAEVAGNREQFDVALANYYHQAQSTRDAGVAARATRIARFLNARRAALRSAQLWAELEPDEAEAQLTATAELTLAGELDQALVHAEKAMELGGDAPLQSLAATAVSNPELVKRITPEFRRLAEKAPDNGEAALALAMMLRAAGNYPEALAIVRRVEEQHPQLLDAPLLKSHLLVDMKREDDAVALLEQMVATYPRETRIRLQYARLLVNRDLDQAQEQFTTLVQQRPADGNLILSLALIRMESEDFAAAEPLLQRLLELEQHESAAHFYLGTIAQQARDPLRAAAHYRQVEPGNDYMQAITRGTELLAAVGKPGENQQWFTQLRQRHPDQSEHFYVMEANLLRKYDQPAQALTLLDQALGQHPDSGRLIYVQSLIHEQLGNTAAFEQGVRQLLARDPDNATLLNALGYKLLDDDSRLQEALELITRALELKPDDPAIIDSMGWVQYRLGNHAEAVRYLEQALEKLPDHEIAAHLGEVLWMQGNRERAMQVWQQGLEINPESEIIPAAIDRLKDKNPMEQHVSDH
ncbi:tetratricopeptide repeat protein [Microbulbifer guangxiensis]|uniref:tetratricopeptide repeat protein n=1 Tax=Microbulbifer guangxiensis TaxID=2904249 RepID=UPI001F3BCEDD|nr:tetratricopeptide repeat protein [Microbulbifer guangxiensis]